MQNPVNHISEHAPLTFSISAAWGRYFGRLIGLLFLWSAAAIGQVSAPLQGTIAVDASNNLAVTADRSGLVRVFDATSAKTPALVSKVTLPRELSAVALADRFLLVAGQGGIQILDITNPKSPLFSNAVELDGEATVVKAAGNLGYTAVGSTIVLFDISTGTIIGSRAYSSLPVSDIALAGDFVYVLYADATATSGFQVVKLQVQGSLGQTIAVWNSPAEQAGLGRMSLYAGDGVLYVGSVLAQAAAPLPGLEVLEDLGTSFALKSGTPSNGAHVVRPSGVGLLAYTGAAEQSQAAGQLGVLDISDLSNTGKVLHVFDIDGPAQAATLYQGYAYVAAGVSGLQAIAYVVPNSVKEAPIVSLSTSIVAETPEKGSLARLTAKVTAADQVRQVDFFVDGEKVATDGDYPFEYRFYEANPDPGISQMVHACVEDIDGNSACSIPEELNSKSKSGLSVTEVTPIDGSHSPRSSKLAISAQFSLALDVSTVVAKNVTLLKVANNAQPVIIPLSSVLYVAATKSITIQPKSTLVSGLYEVVLSSAIKSLTGGSMAADYSWSFNVSPLTDTWTSPVSGDWSVGTNWSLGTTPATGDNVVIGVPGVTVTLSSGSPQIGNLTTGSTNTLNISGGNLTLTGIGAIGHNLNVASGSLGGTGIVTVTGTMNWTGGTLGGTLAIPVGAVLNIVTPNTGCCNPGAFSMSAATINNSGTVNHSWVGGGPGLYVYNGSVINNAGTWNLTSDVLVAQGDSTASVFNNSGKFNKAGGTSTSNWSVPFAGAGPISIQSGTLSLNGTYTKTITGTIAIGTQAQLNYGQGGTLDGGKVTGTGTMNFNQAATVEGVYSFAGTTDITGGTTTFTGATSIATLNLSGGTLVGTAPVTVTGTMNWTGGTLGGTLAIPVGAVLNIVTPNTGCCNPGAFSMSAATINNSGTVNHSWVGGGPGLYVYNGSVINNAGTWNLTSDVLVAQGDSTASVFNNSGKFNKAGGTSTSNWSVPFAGAGPISIQSGTLSLNGTYTKTITGTIAIGTQAQLNYGQGGTLDGGKVTGTGTMNFNQAATVEGVYSFAGTTDITGGTTTFTGATSIATLNLSGGTLVGTAPVTVTGTMNWTGGTLGGTLAIPVGAVLNIVTPNTGCCNPGAFSMSAATINNSGTVNHSWVGGGPGLYVYNGSVINNAGTWNLTSDVLVAQGDSTASVFNNSGKFNKAGGTSTSNWSVPFAGAGPISIQSGTLSLNGTYTKTITGTIAIGTQAQLNYGQGGTLDGGKVTGTGTMNFNQAATVEGVYSFAGTTDITGGTTTFTGATSIATLNLSGGTLVGTAPVTVTGTMNWTGGTLGGTLAIPVGAVLNIVTPNTGCCNPGAFSMSAATINNSGTVNHSWVGGGPGLYVYNGSVINNAGTWNLTSDVLVAQGDSTASVFNNSGKFNKAGGTSTSNWSVPFAGAGPISIQSGTLSLNGTYTKTITGTIAIGTQAQLNYGQGGTLDGGKVTGTGTMNFNQAATVEGVYSFAGTTDITGGTTTFTGATSIATLNLSGGTLVGTAPVTVTGTMNWTGGTLGGTLAIPVGAVLNIVTPNTGCCNPGAFSMSAATINNSGTVNHSWVGGGPGLYVYNGSVINNAGTWNLTSDVLVAQGDSTATAFNNTGTFNKSSGTNATNWSLPLNNAGTMNLNTGSMNLNGFYPTTTLSGTINIAAAAILNYAQRGTLSSGKATGAGTFNITNGSSNGTSYITGTYQLSVPTQILGGTLNVKALATLNANNLTLTTANFQVDGNTSIGNLNVSATQGSSTGSNVSGAGSINVTDTLNWNNGSVSVMGSFNIQNMSLASNSSLSFKLGTSALAVTAKLSLNGTLTITPTSSSPAVGAAFKIINFANNYLGNFLDLNIPVIGTNDYLKESLTASGLSFTVTADSSSSVVSRAE